MMAQENKSMTPLRVLQLEDVPFDAELIRERLVDIDLPFEIDYASMEQEFITFLRSKKYDLILADYKLPGFDAISALRLSRRFCPNTPFICVSGKIGEDKAVELLKKGATDYVSKNQLDKLSQVIRRALDEVEVRRARQLAEETLKARDNTFKKLSLWVPGIIFQFKRRPDGSYCFPFTTDVIKEMVGCTPQEVLEDFSPLAQKILPEDLSKVIDSIEDSAAHMTLWTNEFRLQIPGQPVKWLFSKSTPEKMGDGSIIWHGFVTDISERKQREQQVLMANLEMKQAKERAEESERMKSAFLSNMSHEIRTPMNSIVGFSQLLNAPTLSDKDRISYANIINDSCQRLLKTINDILDISRIDAGQATIKRHQFQVYKLLDELYRAHINSFVNKKIELKMEVSPDLESLVVFSDEQRIYQIFNNLINNALKFTKVGYVKFGLHLVGNDVEFFVQDTGIGIAADKQEFIFGRFNQADTSISREHEGAGLGLAIAKGFVTLLGGKIWLESKLGEGTIFKFTIPYVLPFGSAGPVVESASDLHVDWSQKTILVAEDEKSNFLLIEKVLTERTGVKILRATNGHGVIEMLTNHPEIELILMDLKMPKMDGFAATLKIREFNKKIPIVAVTAYAQREDKRKAFEAGCNEFISKPYQIDFLLKILIKLLK